MLTVKKVGQCTFDSAKFLPIGELSSVPYSNKSVSVVTLIGLTNIDVVPVWFLSKDVVLLSSLEKLVSK